MATPAMTRNRGTTGDWGPNFLWSAHFGGDALATTLGRRVGNRSSRLSFGDKACFSLPLRVICKFRLYEMAIPPFISRQSFVRWLAGCTASRWSWLLGGLDNGSRFPLTPHAYDKLSNYKDCCTLQEHTYYKKQRLTFSDRKPLAINCNWTIGIPSAVERMVK